MPTVFTHPFVALLRAWFPSIDRRAALAGALLTVLPDADVVAFALGIPYAHTFGHRGFTHSIVFAALASIVATLALRHRAALPFLFLCAISHPLLDALTTGGLGVAFFSPFSNERYFFPWRPIRVSPIAPQAFLERARQVLASEVVWVWAPCAAAAFLGRVKAGKGRMTVEPNPGSRGEVSSRRSVPPK